MVELRICGRFIIRHARKTAGGRRRGFSPGLTGSRAERRHRTIVRTNELPGLGPNEPEPDESPKRFDVLPDGQQILLERVRENPDVVLIEVPPS